MAKNDDWLERHKQQTARLNELIAPAIVENRNTVIKVTESAAKLKPTAKIGAFIKLLQERLKNRGDFGTYNACAEIVNLYLALKEHAKAEFNQLAEELLPVIEAISLKIEEYKKEARLESYDFTAEKLAAKKTHGSEMIGIEHLWAKAIIEVLEFFRASSNPDTSR